MTRIPTLSAYERSLDAMAQRRAALAQDQLQLSTGKRVNSPSDDPLAAAQAERIRSQLARISTENRMIGFARQMLSQAENTMGTVVDALQFARESVVAAGNGALSSSDRALIGQQLSGVRDQLLSLANQSDGAGGYVFGGQGTTDVPFDAATGAPNGPPAAAPNVGEQATGLDVSYTTSQNGRAIFVDHAAAGGPKTIFQTLDDLVALIGDPATSAADLSAGLKDALGGIDSALDRVSLARTRAGEQLRAIDSYQQVLESGELDARGRLSDLVDVDYADAISRFQNNRTTLEAAMTAYGQIARMTLFNYL
ncbi:MAG: flagellar hook-associated protein FlgL [Burkholderiales bacterium]|nr:flagellar hook-associated protein FlgL [Burkholderiales bacterium]OJX09126.1 MAG: flagellar hook-associated protein 3 [Burkholderiales bacterium 70-64]